MKEEDLRPWFNETILVFSGLNVQVEQYLNEHVMKRFTNRHSLFAKQVPRNSKTRRRMSVKGAIKKTRSIISIDQSKLERHERSRKGCLFNLLFHYKIFILFSFRFLHFISFDIHSFIIHPQRVLYVSPILLLMFFLEML